MSAAGIVSYRYDVQTHIARKVYLRFKVSVSILKNSSKFCVISRKRQEVYTLMKTQLRESKSILEHLF